ncbi:MAG: PAS domain S-box protein, partial [Moraxellaceae bacterium]
MTTTQFELNRTDIESGAMNPSKEETLELLLSGLIDHALVILDSAGQILEWGGAASRITGYDPVDITGVTLDFLFTDADKTAGIPAMELATALRQGKTEDRRWHLRKDGSRFFASGTITPLHDKGGQLRGFSKVFVDETERQKEAERRTLLLTLARHILESQDTHAKLSQDVFEMIRIPLESDILFNYRITEEGDLELVTEFGVPDYLKLAAARLDVGQAFCGNVAATKQPIAANADRICT